MVVSHPHVKVKGAKGSGLKLEAFYMAAVDVPEHFCYLIEQLTKATQIQGEGNKIPPLISPTTHAQMCLGTWSPNQRSEGHDPKVPRTRFYMHFKVSKQPLNIWSVSNCVKG